MKRKGIRSTICAAITLLLCLQMVFAFGPVGAPQEAYAASQVKFISSIRSSVKSIAEDAGADTSEIAVAKVNNYTNVYSQRGEKGTLKGRLYRGSAAYIIKKKGSYCYISSGSLKGWAKKKCLVTGATAASLVSTMNPRVAVVTGSTLNVRSSATTSSKILAKVKRGTKLVALSVSSNWVRVRLTENKLGYVSRDYVRIESGLYTGVTKSQENSLKKLLNAADDEPSASSKTESTESSSSSSSSDGKWVSLGTFRLTAYCPCAKCNGSSNAGKTATGAKPRAKHTVAVDRKVIKLGSKIKIAGDDTIYVAEDTGVKGKKVDIFFSTHSQTGKFGVKYREVFILKK